MSNKKSKEALEKLMRITDEYVNAADIAPIIGCDPHSIRIQARSDPRKLGFPVIVRGRYVIIPRVPFLRFIGY